MKHIVVDYEVSEDFKKGECFRCPYCCSLPSFRREKGCPIEFNGDICTLKEKENTE